MLISDNPMTYLSYPTVLLFVLNEVFQRVLNTVFIQDI